MVSRTPNSSIWLKGIYGEPRGGLPSYIYVEGHASSAFEKGGKASEIAEMIPEKIGIQF